MLTLLDVWLPNVGHLYAPAPQNKLNALRRGNPLFLETSVPQIRLAILTESVLTTLAKYIIPNLTRSLCN